MTLYTNEYGPADAPTLVLLHGGGASSWSWGPQVEALSEFHLLVPDLPEHGQSGPEAGLLTVENAARQVAELIETRAHGGQAHIAGLSFGAQTGLQLLATRPELVRSAVLSGTFVLPPGKRSPYTQGFMRRMLDWTIAAYMPFRNWSTLVEANRRFYRIPDRYAAEFAADTRRMTRGFFMRMLDANQAFALPTGLERAEAPVLVVAGEQEERSILDAMPLITAALPNARAAIAGGVWHNWSLENPELFNALLRAWISDQTLPPGVRPLNG